MLKCRHVEQRADALVDQTPLPWSERLALGMHLAICRHCRRYVRQLKALVGYLRSPHPAPLSDTDTETVIKRVFDEPEL